MKLLDGKIVKAKIAEHLKAEVVDLVVKPKMVILQVGDLPESNAYIAQKKKFAEEIGAEVVHQNYANDVTSFEIIVDIRKLNIDSSVHGIILQLPVPKNLNASDLIDEINPQKDVDGMTSTNLKKLAQNRTDGFIPATTSGIMSLLGFYNVELEGKKVLMIGRSMLVGKPTALALLNKNATVSIAHSKTKNLPELSREQDVVIVAIGNPRFITEEYFSSNQIVVDVGINLEKVGLKEEIDGPQKTKLVGDVDFENVKDVVGAISPVPGGVGAMTVAALFENLVKACQLQNKGVI